ncbi:Transcriptional regulator, LysR family protein [Minicystis rosea]|nr:Transcriptional regulator, LysR family protein [Minicystis rosea]
MDSLSELNVVVQVAETRSFVEAGRRLGVSASAIGKTIARLEKHFGVRLFHRTTRSVSCTEEGARLLARSLRILAELEATKRDFARGGEVPRGRLRIALPTAIGFFTPLLAEFSRLHPHVDLDVDFSDRLVDVIRDGFDLAIRTGEPQSSRLSIRKLASFRPVIVAAPAYFANLSMPATPPDLARHRLLLYRKPRTGKIEPWPLSGGDFASLDLTEGLVASSIEALVIMAVLGRGVACVPDYFVRQQLSDGRLIRVLEACTVGSNAFHLLWPPGAQNVPRVRSFIDFIVTELPPSVDRPVSSPSRRRTRSRNPGRGHTQ